MSGIRADILMITHRRSEYTKLSLKALLDSCGSIGRVWVWHNGNDAETLAAVDGFRTHPNFFRFHHSSENVGLVPPTNWLWRESDAPLVAKIDDDVIVSKDWLQILARAHQDQSDFGCIGCWPFPDEDFIPELANKKIETFSSGHKLLVNPWVHGTGYLMKKACVDALGFLEEGASFPLYTRQLPWRGWINGYYYPFVFQDHLDDPRSKHSLLKTDEDFLQYLPLSARKNNIRTLQEWQDLQTEIARHIQSSSKYPARFFALRKALSDIGRRIGVH